MFFGSLISNFLRKNCQNILILVKNTSFKGCYLIFTIFENFSFADSKNQDQNLSEVKFCYDQDVASMHDDELDDERI